MSLHVVVDNDNADDDDDDNGDDADVVLDENALCGYPQL